MTPPKSDGWFRHRLLARLQLLILAATIAPMVLMAAAGLSSLDAVRHQVLERRLAIARGAAAHFEHVIRSGLESLSSVSWTDDPAARHETLRAAWQRTRLMRGVLLVDAQGRLLAQEASTGPDWAEQTETWEPLAFAMRTGAPNLFRVSGNESLKSIVFAAVPLRNLQGRIAGAVVGLWDMRSAPWLAVARGHDPGPGLRLELVDDEGVVLLAIPTVDGFPESRHAEAVARRSGRPGIGVAEVEVAPDGKREIVATVPLSVAPWVVLVAEPEEVALSTLFSLRRTWLGLAAVFVLVGAFYAWGVAWSVTRPLAQLEASAARIAAGDLERPVPVRGVDELGRLGSAFEAMRRRLWDTVEALRRSNQEMERRVSERTSELRALYRELSMRDELRARLLGKVISAQEEERKRIARELHDETCQTLSALAMRLDLARSAPDAATAVARMDEAKALASRGVDELHRVMYDLRPSVLDDLGLVAAVRWLAERHLTAIGIRARVEAEEIDRRLPLEIEIGLFRAVQEAISNVVRHAEADGVLVQIGFREGALEIAIEDDGRGFDPASLGSPSATGRGLGILGMRERLELLGGTAHVESSPENGTRVVLRVPMAKGGADAA